MHGLLASVGGPNTGTCGGTCVFTRALHRRLMRAAAAWRHAVWYRAILSGRETEFVIMDWRPEDGTLLHVVSHRTGRVG